MLQCAGASLLADLGFSDPLEATVHDAALAATLRAGDGRLPVALVVTGFAEPLDRFWRIAVTEALARGAAWCFVFNGTHLRIVDAARVYARRFAEFDLVQASSNPAALTVLRRLCSAAAVTAPRTDAASLHALVAESDRHAAGVCRSLRDGVLTASADLVTALAPRRRHRGSLLQSTLEQALTIVYRILFLLFAEARALVPLWHPVYRESYSIESLRDAAERTATAPGMWDSLRAIARLAHGGCRAGDLNVTPFNGRLFSSAHTPLADRPDLDDTAAGSAVLALSTRTAPSGRGRERIAYRDLGVEQLGAVYETLLDYAPKADGERIALEPGSGVRKSTGTFYTPQPLAEYLVRRTLQPLVASAAPEQILQLRILDPSMGSGAFLVAACRCLAAAYERALVRSGAGDLDDRDRAGIRRVIAERCLYGVDLNPMAVQLARLSLWLTTLAADRPLGFLDHRLRAGDSLLGARLSDLRLRPRAARRERDLPLFPDEMMRDVLQDAVPMRFSLEAMPTDTLEQVRAKERAHDALESGAGLAAWRRIADLWCAIWFGDPDSIPSSAFAALSDALLTGRGALPPSAVERYFAAAAHTAAAHRFFHWEIEFPEVFFSRDGSRAASAGFDAVIGNPPWDMVRADAGLPSDRVAARTLRFTRDAGIYTAQSDGHANRYQLFAERSIALLRPGGRLGLVLPSGIVTDHGSARLRRRLLGECDVDALVGLDNRQGIFPIHRSVRFVLLTAARGGPTRSIACRLRLQDAEALEHVGDEPAATSPWFTVRVTRDLLERVSGPDLAVPMVATALELAIVERAAALFPPLGAAEGWAAEFGRELNATDDRGVFSAVGDLPLVEGRHLEPFRVALGSVDRRVRRADAAHRLPSGNYQRPRLGYRDVASATNRRTLIAAVLPPDCVSLHTVVCLRTPLPPLAQHFLCGLFNSLVVNFLVRLRVTTHVTAATVERLPIPTAPAASGACRRIAALARRLARRDDAAAFAQLNADVARLYQLNIEELQHVLDTFPLIPSAERQQVMECFLKEA